MRLTDTEDEVKSDAETYPIICF